MKKLIVVVLGLLLSATASAQGLSTKAFWNDPINHPMAPFILVSAFVFVVLILVVIVALVLLRAFNMLVEQAARERAKALGIEYKPKPSWLSRFSQSLNASVPIENENDIDMGHDFDGIRELDNHLPPWWKWLFYATIGWSAVYIILFHFSGSLPLTQEEYEEEIAVAEEAKRAYQASQPQAVINVETLEFTADAEIIASGKSVFADNNCGSCHRADGGGNTIGPNLTDEYWLHGGDVKKVYTTIKDGFVEKGMPAWGKALSPKEVRDVTFYVMSLQGSNPADAKAPQGELFKTEVQKADTVKARASL
ncbi:MAG TPA: cbb3-type cytochrome c oxidase N-terminal domain-containing protein [Chryseosolibacter sp.]